MSAIERNIASSRIADVANRFLHNVGTIDALVRIALVGIELVAIETRVVIAAVETSLKYAVAIGLAAQPSAAVGSLRLVSNRAREDEASRPRRP